MMDLLSRCRVTTGLPFGYFIIYASLAGAFLGGALACWHTRNRGARTAAGVVAVLAAARFGSAIAAEVLVPVEWNPAIEQSSLVGTWTDGSRRLELEADGRFSLTEGQERQGSWTLDDWNLSLGGARWRVIRARGTERILRDWPEDPDLWNGDLGFRRARP
jgi:hypothetical protein